MLFALFVYILCAFSAWAFERCYPINSLIKRTLVFMATAAAQLMLSIQLLSLSRSLTALNILFANLVLSSLFAWITRKRSSLERIPWAPLFRKRWNELRSAPRDFLTSCLLFCAAAYLAFAVIAGCLLFPHNDSYHFEMPRFWIQHASILPFPVPNSRIVTLSFLSEALQLPAYMAGLEYISVVATVAAGLLAVWVTFSLARRIGASLSAAASAAVLTLGSSTFAFNLQGAGAEMLLQGVGFGGSLIFLMDLAARQNKLRPTVDLGASIFLFLMACGAKNSAMLVAPFYLLFLALACWKCLNNSESRSALLRKFALNAIITGLAGALLTGVAWNNIVNKIWFRPNGLPEMITATVSKNYHPREIWTRICRGAVHVASDTLFVPGSLKNRYEAVCHLAVKIFGGQEKLPEDNSYYSFKPAPFRGLGLVGIFFFLPAVILATFRSVSAVRSRTLTPNAFNTTVLVGMTLAAFLMTHIVLRWQSIGLIRLMFPIVVVGGALTAFLLEKKIFKLTAVGMLSATALLFSVYWAGHIARRHDWVEKPVLSKIARLQNPHSYTAKIQLKNAPPAELFVREDFSLGQLHDHFLAVIKQPAVIGFIGHGNSECYSLFGEHAQNKVVPLVDCRDEEKIMELPRQVDYVVADNRFQEARAWAQTHGFEEIVSYNGPEKELLVGFAKKAP